MRRVIVHTWLVRQHELSEKLVFLSVVSGLPLDIVVGRHLKLVSRIAFVELLLIIKDALDRSAYVRIKLRNKQLLLLVLVDALFDKGVALVNHFLVQLQLLILAAQGLLQLGHLVRVKVHQLVLLLDEL